MADHTGKKYSRITSACNSCRSTKQKVSCLLSIHRVRLTGVESSAAERNQSVSGAWNTIDRVSGPNSKNGPPKGYFEALEKRLQMTENVLLQLLSQVPDAQLSSTFPEAAVSTNATDSADKPLTRLQKKGIEEWAQFPLDTAHNIRKWQHTCMGQEHNNTSSQRRIEAEPLPPTDRPKRRRLNKKHVTAEKLHSGNPENQESSQVPPGPVETDSAQTQ
ncbi:uncharacterized protein N7459_002650 [Penicillium hispanicum]|uniref:uncharacterized protein n=1 Tax=Penicillium hispanicum TaxID=1080232 RepID=UPI00254034C3|nr:uncharacterized protein N7459_002650 [Penicillium hispanicum]KAJ5586885.1 hypothetical protein N7459_002650 [Penicillium hispanicum]